MRLTKIQAETRAKIEQLAILALPPEGLADALVATLSCALPNDGYRLFGIDETTLLINRLLAASKTDEWARREWLSEVYLRADPLGYIELPNLMRMNLPVVANQERRDMCWEYPHEALVPIDDRAHRATFHDLRCPIGGTLLASFSADDRWIASMQMYRRDASSPFRRSDVDFLRLIAPHIGQMISSSLAVERASTQTPPSDASHDASGVVVIDSDGRLRFATPAAETWMARFRDRDRFGPGTLPNAVVAAFAGMKAAKPTLFERGWTLGY